jgi:hypothetical protein
MKNLILHGPNRDGNVSTRFVFAAVCLNECKRSNLSAILDNWLTELAIFISLLSFTLNR